MKFTKTPFSSSDRYLEERSVLQTVLFTLFFLFFSSPLQAKMIEADYSVEFGIVGQVGKVHAMLKSDNKHYIIDVNVSALGIAKAVTDNLKERHISKGHVVKGVLITDMYQMIKSYGEFTSTTIYKVNHKKKSVTRQYKKWRYDKLIIDRKAKLGYYGKDDMMTFFLNLPQHIKKKNSPKTYLFKVVGADRKNGRVDVIIPSSRDLNKVQEFVGKGDLKDWFMTVIMYRQLYQSSQGELDVRMDQEGSVDMAVLKDLIFFGDVRIIKQ